MKHILMLNIENDVTRYFFSDTAPEAKDKMEQHNWKKEYTIRCHLVGNFYEPVMLPQGGILECINAYAQLSSYLGKYAYAINNLPHNMPKSINFRKVAS